MQVTPKISIVTPTYNQGMFIEETIQSILDQGYPNLEYIIMDGGSTDNTVEIIKKYEKYLAYWVSEKDRGQSHAINKGLVKCTGEIFNWINSDDYYEGKVFQRVADLFAQDGVHMVAGRSRIFGGEKEWISAGTKFPEFRDNRVIHPSIDQPATFFSMEAVRKFGLLSDGLHYTMDLEWLLKFWLLFGKDKAIFIDDVIINFREHPNSKTVSSQKLFSNDRIKIYQSILYQLGAGVPEPQDYQFIFPMPISVSLEIMARISNRYVFHEMQVAFSVKDYDRYKKLSRLVVLPFLSMEDHTLYKKQVTLLPFKKFLGL